MAESSMSASCYERRHSPVGRRAGVITRVAPRSSSTISCQPPLINMHIPLREGDVQPGSIEAFLDLFVQMEVHRPVVA
jgi:hypothetical protein